MDENSAAQEASADKSRASMARMQSSPRNQPSIDNARLGGALCQFELVRGRGDAEVSRLAELQHGHIHLFQLRAAGIGKNALAHRIRTGRLHAALPCVFLVGRPQPTELGPAMAAALHFRGDALVTGLASAQIWGMLDTTQTPDLDDPVDVLRPGRNGGRPRGVRVHRTNTIARQDIRWCKGIPVTSPALTILRLAAEMDEFELETVLSAGFRKNLVRRTQLDDVMQRNPRAKGIGKVRMLLEQTESLRDTRSRYERKLLKLLEAAELPRPLTNTTVAGRMVDAVWPDLRLIIEFDGWQDHGKRKGFETDRLRDQHLLIAGHHVMRVTFRQIDHRPHALIARIAGVITSLRSRLEATEGVIATGAVPARAG
jgi:very-short-patch-repair endonuclease